MYKNLTIIFKDGEDDDDFATTYKTEYENTSFDLVGNHMIIQCHKKDEEDGEYIVGHVFNLNQIKSFKAV
jgi:hypothetical protein